LNQTNAAIFVKGFSVLIRVGDPQQVGPRNLIFRAEVVEQHFGAVVLPHHDQHASDDQNQTEHEQILSSSMLLLNLILLIDVTFSTPTPGYANHPC
jgi:hypothetical protein